MPTEVHISEIAASVHATDSSAPLSRAQLLEIARLVMQMVREADAHRERAAAERRITQGVSAERDADQDNQD
jgi:hypothetical protein